MKSIKLTWICVVKFIWLVLHATDITVTGCRGVPRNFSRVFSKKPSKLKKISTEGGILTPKSPPGYTPDWMWFKIKKFTTKKWAKVMKLSSIKVKSCYKNKKLLEQTRLWKKHKIFHKPQQTHLNKNRRISTATDKSAWKIHPDHP